MRLFHNSFVAAAALFATVAAPGQATPPSSEIPPSEIPKQPQEAKLQAASVDDIKVGALVYGQKGGLVGKIRSINEDNAVVDTGKVSTEVAISAFMKSDKGLMINMTKAQLEAAAKKTKPPK